MRQEFDLKKTLKEFLDVGSLKELPFYKQSKDVNNNCQFFEFLNQKYSILQKQFANSFQELNEIITQKAYRKEYSKGGTTIHRGFYSPSFLDLVVRGCNRGRLLNRAPKSNAYDYEYIFDNDNNLICSKKYSNEFGRNFEIIAIELLVYEKDKVLSFTFEPQNEYTLYFISECQYKNGRLLKYESALCNEGQDCTEINVEISEYADNLLKSVYWYRYAPSIKLLDQNKFVFFRDESGCLSTYTVERIGMFDRNDSNNSKESYKVNVKRK